MKATNSRLSICAKAAQQAAYGKLDVQVKASGDTANVYIIGELYGGWSEDSFRSAMYAARTSGANNVKVYINSTGGDVFAANEIVNIINDFVKETGGTVTGRGGALVASAATFIAVHCQSFEQASNGQFMIHKPHAWVHGTADEIESSIKLLRNIEEQYADAYSKKTGKTAADIRALYEKGDYWLTAKEAKASGFIDNVSGEEELTEETQAMYAACGRSLLKINQANSNQEDNMELKLMAVALGLDASASEVQVTAEIKRLREEAAELKVLRTQMTQAAATAISTRINAVLDAGVQNMQFAADAKEFMRTNLQAAASRSEEAFNAEIARIEAMPKAQSLAGAITPAATSMDTVTSAIPADRKDWDFKKWNAEDPKGWEVLVNADDAGALKLFNAHFGSTRKSFND